MELNEYDKALEVLRKFPFHNEDLNLFKNELEEKKVETEFNSKSTKY